MAEFYSFISYGIIGIAIFITLLLLVQVKKLIPSFKIVTYYLMLSTVTEVCALVTAKVYHVNNLIFFHIFAPLELILLGWFFFDFYKKYEIKLSFAKVVSPFIGLLILNSLFLQPYTTYNSYALTLVGLLVIAMSLYAFYLMLEEDREIPLLFEIKWFMISFFIMHCSSLMVLFFSNMILSLSKEQQLIIWVIRAFITLIVKLLQLYISIRLIQRNLDDTDDFNKHLIGDGL